MDPHMDMMFFHTSLTDAALWSSWQPKTEVQYAFTFLAFLVLAIAHRGLNAYMHVWERKVRVRNLKLGSVLVQKINARSEADVDGEDAVLVDSLTGERPGSTNSNSSTVAGAGTEEKHRRGGVDRHGSTSKAPIIDRQQAEPLSHSSSQQSHHEYDENLRVANPWRISVDLPRGLLQFLHSGLGYVLMLIVMTANAGYFFAILVGILIGEVAFGRYAKPPVLFPVRRSQRV